MTAHYFLGTQPLGTSHQHWWETGTPASASHLLICPRCGETWGRILDTLHPDNWLPLRRACPSHPGFIDRYPGSFLPPWPYPIEHLPLPLLRREFLLAFSHSPSLRQS